MPLGLAAARTARSQPAGRVRRDPGLPPQQLSPVMQLAWHSRLQFTGPISVRRLITFSAENKWLILVFEYYTDRDLR